uniref:LRRCT domain-containing protein n=2 Tax=Oncorhynchus mykiss TaxID=8022 RepID=A0A8C7W8Y9_ONCMY
MLSIPRTQCLSSCPASCVVCSDDAVICHKLSNFIEAPETTRALMLTDGAIVSVDRHFLSDMSNMTVLSLSHNAITTLTHDAFQNLTILHTLLLDHNHLSSQTLDRATFSWLPRLEILQLGNNALREVKGSWFHAARALRTLQLGGNLLTRLDATTFASADLRALENLDLSDNLITYLGRDSFRGLPGLRSLDLSRNQLRNALPEAFSYLSWLTSLNLELNRWNCTCELRELASFLTSYMEAPDKVLFNGRRMVCVSADNPAVKTVLELTEANCVPPNQNITVQVEAKNSVSPQRYTRDLALAAAFCFAGQYLRNYLINDHMERAMYDLRMGKDGRHFTRPHCGPAVTGSAVEQGGGDEHMNTLDMLRQGGAQPNKMGSLAMTDERRRHVPTQALISKMEGKHVLVNIFPDCVASTWGCVKHTL